MFCEQKAHLVFCDRYRHWNYRVRPPLLLHRYFSQPVGIFSSVDRRDEKRKPSSLWFRTCRDLRDWWCVSSLGPTQNKTVTQLMTLTSGAPFGDSLRNLCALCVSVVRLAAKSPQRRTEHRGYAEQKFELGHNLPNRRGDQYLLKTSTRISSIRPD